jgi:hypothetical protein
MDLSRQAQATEAASLDLHSTSRSPSSFITAGVTGPVDWRAGEDPSVDVSSGLEEQTKVVAAVPPPSNQRWGEYGPEVL